ncbi:unnamed protein product, partial [Musa acuminata subsp. burmannicoides]
LSSVHRHNVVREMSISMECYCLSLLVPRLFSECAVLLSLVVRWLFLPCCCWWPASSPSANEVAGAEASDRHCVAAQAVRDSLHVSSYGALTGAAAEGVTTCAVCLSEMRTRDRVWELRNCAHVFHKACLDRWLDHDKHLTCPLCRAPLLSEPACLPSASASAASEPSWAVERLVYLFSDDFLFAPAC